MASTDCCRLFAAQGGSSRFARYADGKPYSVRYEAVNAMLLNEFLKAHRTVQEQEAAISQLKSTVSPPAVFSKPVVLSWSAPTPLAVLLLPVVLLRSAARPVAVLKRPVMLLYNARNPGGRVVDAGSVAKKRLINKGGLRDDHAQNLERILTLGRVGARIASVRCRANPESFRDRRKREQENCDKSIVRGD